MAATPQGFEQHDLAQSWQATPSLAGEVNPFLFSHRMATYRMLLEATQRGGNFGADNTGNPLWGLAFQLQWQYRSGRLDPQGRNDCIDPDAPWGYGNYTLNLIPLLGAIRAGLVPDLRVLPAQGESRFEYASGAATDRKIPDALEAAVDDWRGYFEAVQRTQPGQDQEPLRMSLWEAHKTSLDVVAAKLDEIEPRHYSGEEIEFLRGWCRMVDFLWAAAWPTDFAFMVEHGLELLPERVLTAEDRAGGLRSLPVRAANNVRNVVSLARTPTRRFRFNLWLWRRAMRTRPARDEVVDMLQAVFDPKPDRRKRRRLIRYVLSP